MIEFDELEETTCYLCNSNHNLSRQKLDLNNEEKDYGLDEFITICQDCSEETK